MIKTLDRYLLRSFFWNYGLALAVLISLYVVLDLFVNFDEFTESGKSTWVVVVDIWNYYRYNLPMYFAQLSGVITLFAACGVMTRLHRCNEITAILASGSSLFRLAAPIILAGFAMNVLLFVDQEFVLPKVAAKLARKRDDVEGARAYGVWAVKDSQGRQLNAVQFSPRERQIRGLIIMETNSGNQKGRLGDIITADKAEWDDSRQGWKLTSRGVKISLASNARGYSGDEAIIRTPVDFYACNLSPDELLLRQQTQWMRFLSIQQLNSLAKSRDVNVRQIAKIKHERFTMPIQNMIFLLLGLTFFLNRHPQSVLSQGAQSLGVTSLAFIISFLVQQLAGATLESPALPAWLPIFIFGPVAVLLLDNVKT